MAKLSEDQIKWALSLDAGGVQGEINGLNSSIYQLEQTNKTLNGSLKETQKELQAMQKEMEKLEKTGQTNSTRYTELSKKFSETQKAANSLSNEIASNNKKIQESANQVKSLTSSMSASDMTMSQLRKRSAELKAQLDVTSASANPKEYKRLQQQLAETTEAMDDLSSKGRSTLTNLSAIPGPVGKVGQSIQGLSKAFKLLIANPVGVVIMAIVVAFQLMKKAIEGSDKATTIFTGIMQALGSVLDSVLRIVTQVYAAIFDLITLNFDGLKEHISNIGDLATNMVDAAGSAYEAALAEDALNDAIARNNDLTEVNKARISELRQISGDTTKTIQERIDASNELMKLEKDNYKMAVDNISGQYDVWKGKNANLIAAMKKGSSAQFAEVEKYMKMVKEGTELTYEQRVALANLTNDITTTLDEGTEEQKAEFRQFFNDLSNEQQAYYDNSKKDKLRHEKIIAESNKSAFENAEKALEDSLKKQELAIKKSQASQNITDEQANAQLRKAKSDSLQKKLELYKKYKKDVTALEIEIANEQITATTAAMNEEINAAKKTAAELTLTAAQDYADGLITKQQYEDKIKGIKETSLQAIYSITLKYGKDTTAIEQQIADTQIKNKQDADKKLLEATKKAKEEALKVLQETQNSELRAVDANLRAGIISADQAENERLKINKQYADLRVNLARQYFDTITQMENNGVEGAKEVAAEAGHAVTAAVAEADAAVTNLNDKFKGTAAQLSDVFSSVGDTVGGASSGILKSFSSMFKGIETLSSKSEKSFGDYAGAIGSILSGAVSAIGQYTELVFEQETAALEAEKQKQLTIAGDNAEERERIEQEYAQKELDLQKKQAVADAAVQTANLWISTATGIITAWATAMQLGPIAGPIAGAALTALLLATAGIQQATIIKQRDAILNTTLESTSTASEPTNTTASVAPVTNVSYKDQYASGGYTGDGGKYEPAGIVHKGEYVVAQEEMSNPAIIPMVRAIEGARLARRGGSHSSVGGYADGGYVEDVSAATDSTGQLVSIVASLAAQVAEIKNKPVTAVVNYKSFETAQEKMEQIKALSR